MKAAPVVSTVRAGSLRLDIRRYGDGRVGFDFTPPGEMRIKVRLHDQSRAEERAREILGAARGGKVERLAIDEDEYAEFLRWKAERGSGEMVKNLVQSFLETKDGKGKSSHYTRRLRKDLEGFAEAFPGRIDRLTRAEIERWLNARNVGPRRWNNLRESIIALHKFARREGALGVQLSGAELIERQRVVSKIETYTPAELERIIAVTPHEWLPLVVLGAFCGLRPMEISPDPKAGKHGLRWGNLNWQKRKVDVPAEVSKTRRRRFAPLTDAALAFLADRQGEPPAAFVCPPRRAPTDEWGRLSGVGWRNDALRHSFASYRLAITQNMAALALEMGNSPDMIHRHYLDLKHDDEGQAWFAIRPAKVPKTPKSIGEEMRTKPVRRAHDTRAVCAQ